MAFDLDTVEMGTDVAGVNRKERLLREAFPFRERLARDLGEQFPVYATTPGVNFDMKTIPALRGRVFVHFEVAFHHAPPIVESVPKVKGYGASHVKDEKGDLVYEERPMFQGPPWAQLNVDLSHDGSAWDTRMVMVDLRPGRGGEPVFSHEDRNADLDVVADKTVPGICARAADIR